MKREGKPVRSPLSRASNTLKASTYIGDNDDEKYIIGRSQYCLKGVFRSQEVMDQWSWGALPWLRKKKKIYTAWWWWWWRWEMLTQASSLINFRAWDSNNSNWAFWSLRLWCMVMMLIFFKVYWTKSISLCVLYTTNHVQWHTPSSCSKIKLRSFSLDNLKGSVIFVAISAIQFQILQVANIYHFNKRALDMAKVASHTIWKLLIST